MLANIGVSNQVQIQVEELESVGLTWTPGSRHFHDSEPTSLPELEPDQALN